MKWDILIMRAGAWLLDLVLLFVFGGLTLFLFLAAHTLIAGAYGYRSDLLVPLKTYMVWAARVVIFLVLPIAFDTLLTLGKTKSTYGKVVFEVRVIFEHGMKLSRVVLRSALKYLPLGLSFFLLGFRWPGIFGITIALWAWTVLDWFSPLFLPANRAFHDIAAGSRVEIAGKNIEGEGLERPEEK